jgi:hypothetical protein
MDVGFDEPHWWGAPDKSGDPFVGKLDYMRAGYDARKETDPKLTVVARRLDGVAPSVWAFPASATWGPGDDNLIHLDLLPSMSKMTGINLPTAGCWEIAAHYRAADNREKTLSFTVLLLP